MAQNKKDWEQNTLKPSIERFGESSDHFTTDSGLEIDAVYSVEDTDQT